MSALELREVVKHYRAGDETVKAVNGVSLTVAPGEPWPCMGRADRARRPCS